MVWKKLNVNPSNRTTNDDAIKALSVALNKQWKDIYIFVAKYALGQRLAMDDKRAIKGVLRVLGYTEIRLDKQCNVEQFIRLYAERGKTYILQLGSNFTVIKNEILIESYDARKKMVSSYWKIC